MRNKIRQLSDGIDEALTNCLSEWARRMDENSLSSRPGHVKMITELSTAKRAIDSVCYFYENEFGGPLNPFDEDDEFSSDRICNYCDRKLSRQSHNVRRRK